MVHAETPWAYLQKNMRTNTHRVSCYTVVKTRKTEGGREVTVAVLKINVIRRWDRLRLGLVSEGTRPRMTG